MLPVATLTSVTATGDAVVGPGDPKCFVKCLPVACMGDAVAGAACTGAISSTTSKVIALCRPVATMASAVAGVNPVTGIPLTTAIAVSIAVNDIR